MAERFLLPLTRSSGFGPLPDLTEEMAGSKALDAIFADQNLPLGVIEDRDVLLPLSAMIGVFESAGRVAGDRTFGYLVGSGMRPKDYGPWAHYSATAPTLAVALERAGRTVQYQQPGGSLTLEKSGEAVVWRYRHAASAGFGTHHSDHVVGAMMRFVRVYLGPFWRPVWAEVDYPRDPGAASLETLLAAPILFERSGPGIGIGAADLCAASPHRMNGSPTLVDVQAQAVLSGFAEPVHTLLAILILRLVEGRSDIDGAARLAGVSVQSLQRMLRQDGLTYRDLLATARLMKAKALLTETDRTVTEIALHLGYSDPANFTRAFRKAEGRSPAQFRASRRGPSDQPTAGRAR